MQLFNKGDRSAILVLASLTIISLIIIVIFGVKDEDSLENNKNQVEKISDSSTKIISNDETANTFELKTFDPNTVDSVSLITLGLKPYQVHSFLKYRSAGAVFRKSLDITKVYCLEDEDIDRLLPLVQIDDKYSKRRTKYPINKTSGYVKKNYNKNEKYKVYNRYDKHSQNDVQTVTFEEKRINNTNINKKFETLTLVDVNVADTTILKRIPGIGSYIAKKIVNLRTQLGAIHSIKQLSSLPHMSPEIMKWLTISPDCLYNVKKLNINTATFNQLRQHPYIGYNHARDIQRYINIYGKVRDEEQLLSANIFQPEEMKLLSPYLEY